MRDAPKGVHLKNRLSSITQGLIERSALFSFHPPTSVRLPLRFRVLASQKATSVPHQSEKDYQSFSAVVSIGMWVTIQTLSPRHHTLSGCQGGGSSLLRHVV